MTASDASVSHFQLAGKSSGVQRHHVDASRDPGHELLPGEHELAALLQRIAAPIGALGLIADSVRKGGLCHLAGKGGLFVDPIAE